MLGLRLPLVFQKCLPMLLLVGCLVLVLLPAGIREDSWLQKPLAEQDPVLAAACQRRTPQEKLELGSLQSWVEAWLLLHTAFWSIKLERQKGF